MTAISAHRALIPIVCGGWCLTAPPPPHRSHTGRPAAHPRVRVLCEAERQRLPPLAWVGAVLTVPLPLPDLTPTTRGRGQEAAPQDGTHPGKIKNMKDKKHRSRDKSIVVLTTRMTVERASRNTQVQAASAIPEEAACPRQMPAPLSLEGASRTGTCEGVLLVRLPAFRRRDDHADTGHGHDVAVLS